MSVKMKFGSKDIPFVYKGDKLIYPNPIKDGLLLWYDFKGMRNTDTNKEVAKDLSGNGNNGTLTNFNFTEESGYKDNTLVFDGVDDSLTIPELVLDETAMSVMHDGKIYSYEDDKVIKVKKYSDGAHAEPEGIEVGGKNLIGNSKNFWASAQEFYDKSHRIHEKYAFFTERLTENIFGKTGTYTLSASVRAKASNPDTTFEMGTNVRTGTSGVEWSDRTIFGDTNGEWIRISTTQKITDIENDRILVALYGRNINEGDSWETKDWKFEKGNKATEWTPSPEDFQTTSLSPSSLSNLQLYNRPLHKDEILHNAESDGLKKLKPGVIVQDGLMLHYDFSHESNTSEYKGKAFDYSGNGNHGELQNFNFTEESGYEGGGLKFDGVDDEVIVGTFSDSRFHQPAMTVEWTGIIRAEQPLSGINSIFHAGYIAGWALGFHGQYNGLMATVKDSNGASGYRISYPIHNPIRDIPYNLIMVFQQGSKKEYLNGVLVSEDSNFGFPDYTSTPQVRIARSAYQNTLSCKIYNRPLTPEEIAHNYAIEKEKFDIIEGEM